MKPPVAVFQQALISRLGIIAIGTVLNLVIPDHKPDAFQLGVKPEKVGDYFVEFFLGGFSRWDAQHFINVAMHGYSSVENFAFFPLYPMMIRVIAGVILRPLAGILSEYYRALLAGCFLSSLCFCFSAVVLYRLWMRLTHRVSSSSFIIALAVINPATVFFTSCYTESPFLAATLMGIYLLCMEHPKPWLASLSFSFASALRSNGILNAGYIAHFGVYQILRECAQVPQRRESQLNFLILRMLAETFLQILLVVSPFIIFNVYGWYHYCHSEHFCELFKMTDCQTDKPPFCDWDYPVIYSYVQTLWDNGFLKYWQLKKIPLFLLAAPTVWWSLKAIAQTAEKCVLVDIFAGRYAKSNKPWASEPFMIASSLHLLYLVLFGVFFMNVEVTTRLVWSSSPYLYIFTCQILHSRISSHLRRKFLTYTFLYLFLGLALHCNNFPWT